MNDNNINMVYEGHGNEQTSHFYGSRPGRLYVWNELNKNFRYVYMIKTQPDHEDFPLSFPSKHHASRCIFIGSHIELNNNLFVDSLINNYTLAVSTDYI